MGKIWGKENKENRRRFLRLFAVIFAACAALLALTSVFLYTRKRITKNRMIVSVSLSVLIAAVFSIPPIAGVFNGTSGRELKLPLVTWILILALCLFNSTIMKTKLGQKFRAVGQSQTQQHCQQRKQKKKSWYP